MLRAMKHVDNRIAELEKLVASIEDDLSANNLI